MSPITSHVLDTALGRPARGVAIRLEVLDDSGSWRLLSERVTDASGRVSDLLEGPLERRSYRLTFATGAYFEHTGQSQFYPHVEIVFRVEAPAEHYHIPLLLSPFGYSTYRGS